MLRQFGRSYSFVCPTLLLCLTVMLSGCGQGLRPVNHDDFDQFINSGAAAQSWPLLFYKVCNGEKSVVLALDIARPWEFSSPPDIIYTYNALEEEEHEFVRRNQALYEAYTRGETQNFWWAVWPVWTTSFRRNWTGSPCSCEPQVGPCRTTGAACGRSARGRDW